MNSAQKVLISDEFIVWELLCNNDSNFLIVKLFLIYSELLLICFEIEHLEEFTKSWLG